MSQYLADRSISEPSNDVPLGPDLDVPFRRSRFLKAVGATLFGAAGALVLKSAPAEAHNLAVPQYCFGYGKCHYCNGRICTQYCWWPDGHGQTHGCPTNAQCWNTCGRDGYTRRCCDWHASFPEAGFHHCICSEIWSYC